MTSVASRVAPARSPTDSAARVRAKLRTQGPAALALLPAAIVVVVGYLGAMVWTVRLSFTSTKMLPVLDWVGLQQYRRLFSTERFIDSAGHIVLFGVLFIAGCLVLGFLLAVFIDQRVRMESAFRTIFLYPYAMSFVVTGLGVAAGCSNPSARPPEDRCATWGSRTLHVRLDRATRRSRDLLHW